MDTCRISLSDIYPLNMLADPAIYFPPVSVSSLSVVDHEIQRDICSRSLIRFGGEKGFFEFFSAPGKYVVTNGILHF